MLMFKDHFRESLAASPFSQGAAGNNEELVSITVQGSSLLVCPVTLATNNRNASSPLVFH